MAEEEIDYDEELQSGKYLFKYCKFDVYTIQTIINKALYFCTPDKLNDPLDSNFDLIIENPENFSDKTRDSIKFSGFPINERVRYLVRCANLVLGDVKRQKEFLTEFSHDRQNNFLGISSFSTKVKDKNLMWSHYANEAKGLCLVFDREQLIQSLFQNKSKYYEMYKDNISYDGIKPLIVEITKDGELLYTYDHLFSKTQHWAGEEEYRIIIEKIEKDWFYPNYFDPFLKFEDQCLKFIIVGQRTEPENLEILERLRSQKCFEATILKHTFDR